MAGALSPAELEELGEALRAPALDFAAFYDPLPVHHHQVHVERPMTVLPVKVPAKAHREAQELTSLWNRLIDAVSRDVDWLHATLEGTAEADDFTRRLLDISRGVHADPAGLAQRLFFGLYRCDYMLHQSEGLDSEARFMHVEINTISAGGQVLYQALTNLHRFLLGRFSLGDGSVARMLRRHFGLRGETAEALSAELAERLPENRNVEGVASAFARAHSAYCAQRAAATAAGAAARTPTLLIAIEEGDLSDESWLEFRLWTEHAVPCTRRTLREVAAEGVLEEGTRCLLLEGGALEVSVVYFRVGFQPQDYPTDTEWAGRAVLERSLAVKCPPVSGQLAGTKKVQQALCAPGGRGVERFLGADDAARLRSCFMSQWALGPDAGDEGIVDRAMAAPHGFVLKPQREGGGNNFYGEGLVEKLGSLSPSDRAAYVLMERIALRAEDVPSMRGHDVTVCPTVAEVGFFSVFLGDGGDSGAIFDEHVGFSVKTKPDGADEGCVTKGYGARSSVFLVD